MRKWTFSSIDPGAHYLPTETEHATELLELGDAFFEMDSDWRIVRVNRRQEELFGIPRSDSVGRTFEQVWPELVHPASRYWREYDRCKRERMPVQFEEYFAPLGLWTAVTAYPVSTGGIAVFFRDVTERRRAEVDVSEREARLRVMFDNMSEGVMLFAADGDALYQSPAALRIRGFVDDQGQLKDPDLPATWKIRDGDGSEVPAEQWPLARVLRGEHFENCVLHAERLETGHTFDACFNGHPITDAAGKLLFGFITIRDISDQSRAEAALRDANAHLVEAAQRKDEFLAMLSHELRNPLAPIRNALHVLDHPSLSAQQARGAREVAKRQLAHLSRLVDDLLDVTRIARGMVELKRLDVDVGLLAQRMADDYLALMRERALKLVVSVPDYPVIVHADDARLAQVLANLLSNATKFTPAGGCVTITVASHAAHVVIRVHDTGVGIAADLLPTIFDPFVQAAQGLARTEGGLGLGLAIVKGIVELHGGTVAATSMPGAGTEFMLALPAAVRAAPALNGGSGSAATPRHRVLVVDDNHDAADSLAELLVLFGHEVEVAYDGPSALARAKASCPAVVLCDIGLPGMDGYEVARALRTALGKRFMLVALSGYARPEDVRKSTEAGFDAHIAKPAELERIADLLASFSGAA